MLADTAGPYPGHDGGSSGLPPLIFAFNVMGHITEQALGKAIPDISGANARIIILLRITIPEACRHTSPT